MTPDFDKTCFVIMPFGKTPEEKEKFSDVYENLIKSSVQESHLGLECVRVDEESGSTSILIEILEYLVKSKVVIADLTNLNPNVMYELGMRHAKSFHTIIIAEDKTKPPFDILGIRTIFYSKAKFKLMDEAKDKINKYLKKTDEFQPFPTFIDYILRDNNTNITNGNIDSLEKFKNTIDSMLTLIKAFKVENWKENDYFTVYQLEVDSEYNYIFVYKDYVFDFNSLDFYANFVKGIKFLSKNFPKNASDENPKTIRFLFPYFGVIKDEKTINEKLEKYYSESLPTGILESFIRPIMKYTLEKNNVNCFVFDKISLDDYEQSICS